MNTSYHPHPHMTMHSNRNPHFPTIDKSDEKSKKKSNKTKSRKKNFVTVSQNSSSYHDIDHPHEMKEENDDTSGNLNETEREMVLDLIQPDSGCTSSVKRTMSEITMDDEEEEKRL